MASPPDDVHFHELGSLDTLVDVCGAFVLLDELDVERVVSSPLPFARGFVNAAHGVLPLPAPATLGLLEGAALVGVDTEAELVTPTGAAIAATVVEAWGALPPLTLEAVGYGAGTKDFSDRPNVVRVVLGAEASRPTGRVALLETNLDDFCAGARPGCRPSGASRQARSTCWTVPAQMKKGRPGFVLSVLARPDAQGEIARILLEETSALGVRVAAARPLRAGTRRADRRGRGRHRPHQGGRPRRPRRQPRSGARRLRCGCQDRRAAP